MITVKNKLLDREMLMRAYKKNYNVLKMGVKRVEKVINRYNNPHKDYKVSYEIEPSRYYVYVTSTTSIRKSKTFYNKLGLQSKLFVDCENERQSIWTPYVANGGFIKIA